MQTSTPPRFRAALAAAALGGWGLARQRSVNRHG